MFAVMLSEVLDCHSRRASVSEASKPTRASQRGPFARVRQLAFTEWPHTWLLLWCQCDAHCSSGTCCSGSSTTPTSTRHTPRVRKCARLRGSAARRVPVRGRRRARRRRQPRRHAHTHDANIGMGLERRIVRALTSKTCAYRIPTRISYTLLSIAADAPTRIFAACFAAPKAKAQGFFFGLALVPPAADVPGVMPSFASCSSLRSFGSHASGT